MSSTAITSGPRLSEWPQRILLPCLALALAAACVLSLGAGAVTVTGDDLLSLLTGRSTTYSTAASVVWAIRLPRAVLGALAGAGLAAAGAMLQALFRNPLADPGLIGVSSGAALSAAAVLVLGERVVAAMPAVLGVLALPMAAFAGGLATVLVVLRLAHPQSRVSTASLLLAGIAVNALAGAATGLLVFIASDAQLRAVMFWNLGSLGGATWTAIAGAAPLLILALLLAPRFASRLNLLLLGEAEAAHLGVDVEQLKLRVIAVSGLAVGAGVAVTGVIGFVGLVVPHLVRLLGGADHRLVIPGSALLGAALLLVADVIARTVAVPSEVPIGIITAFLGAPFLLWLLRRRTLWGSL